MIWSESRGSGAGVSVTLTVAVAETREPSGFDNKAVIVLVPRLTPVARPLPEASPEVTVATDGMLEAHVDLRRVGYILLEAGGSGSGKRNELAGLA